MLEQLRKMVGGDAVRAGDDGWAVHGRAPRAVVFPGTDEEAAAVLALASAEGWAVELAGAGTGLDHGRRPAHVNVVVSTARMRGVTDYEPADLVATVGAGTSLAELAEHLAGNRQWLPLDPPGHERATLGAVAATASAGALREGHGTPRDHVLGLRLVTGDGRILDLGGRVVKNVAGYDLVRLAIGSRGTLGLVTRLHVRLRALPARDETIVVRASEPAPLVDVISRLREERIEAAALELVSGPLPGSDHDGWTLLGRFQGSAETVVALCKQAASIGIAAGLEATVIREAPDVWRELSREETHAPTVIRLADAPARLAETLELATRFEGATRIAAHAGQGIVRLLGGPDADRWTELAEAARAELAARRGTLTIARASTGLIERVDPFGDAGPTLRLMQELKKQFDPAGILAPGRFVV